jgi:alpha-N-arabinofuranosidase
MYQFMERLALQVQADVATFDSPALVNITALRDVPYLDVTATRDQAGKRLVFGIVNRHPQRAIRARLALRGFGRLRPVQAWQMSNPDPLAFNTFDDPERVRARPAALPELRGDGLTHDFPACSVTVLILEV